MAVISTYATLQTALANWSERSDLTALLPDFVNYAHQEIGRTLRANVNLLAADVTVSGEFVTVPTGFRAMKRAYYDTTPRRTLIMCSAEMRADIVSEFASGTYASHVSVEGSSLAFGPVPTGGGTVKTLYYATPTALVDDADTNAVLTLYPFMYLYGALAELFRYIEDDNNADRYETRFRGLIKDTNLSEAQDALRGATQGRSNGGVV